MQVFVPYAEPIKVAECLDGLRLRKQLIENKQILDAIDGVGKGWFNHPVTKMYEPYREWLYNYTNCLQEYYKAKQYYGEDSESYSFYCRMAIHYSKEADKIRPLFLTEEFCNQHKRRLYTKNPEYYIQFAIFGKSEENWYFVDGKLVKYVNGKRISE